MLGRAGCLPTLYVDGVELQRLGTEGGELDEVLQPGDLEALEVYSAAQTPGQFRAGRCGAIVAWTHVPERGVGSPFDWTRAAVAAGAVILGFLFVF